LGAGHVAITPCIRNPGDLELALMTISEELAKLDAEQGLSAEVAEAAEDLVGLADESVTWRLGQAAQARNLAMRSEHEDKAEYDTAPNGARISRDEKSAFDALLNKLNVTKEP
jgi:DNA primase